MDKLCPECRAPIAVKGYGCQRCCEHEFDPDEGYTCLNCAKNGYEDVASDAFDYWKDLQKYGE